MKLIFAIIRYDNEDEVVNALTQKRFSITKLSSTGGFLRKGNTTLMIGTEEECKGMGGREIPSARLFFNKTY